MDATLKQVGEPQGARGQTHKHSLHRRKILYMAGDMAHQALEMLPAANGNTCLREVGEKEKEDKSWERAQGSACHSSMLLL